MRKIGLSTLATEKLGSPLSVLISSDWVKSLLCATVSPTVRLGPNVFLPDFRRFDPSLGNCA